MVSIVILLLDGQHSVVIPIPLASCPPPPGGFRKPVPT